MGPLAAPGTATGYLFRVDLTVRESSVPRFTSANAPNPHQSHTCNEVQWRVARAREKQTHGHGAHLPARICDAARTGDHRERPEPRRLADHAEVASSVDDRNDPEHIRRRDHGDRCVDTYCTCGLRVPVVCV